MAIFIYHHLGVRWAIQPRLPLVQPMGTFPLLSLCEARVLHRGLCRCEGHKLRHTAHIRLAGARVLRIDTASRHGENLFKRSLNLHQPGGH